jgi:rod shape-determining protein MreD
MRGRPWGAPDPAAGGGVDRMRVFKALGESRMMHKSSLWLLVLLTIILNLTLFNKIEIWGIRPDSTVIVLVYVALGFGPVAGALFGFMMGLAEFSILSASMSSMPLAGTVVGFLVGRYGRKIMHESYAVQILIIFLAVIVTDVINFAWYDPDALSVVLARYTLLGALYTAVVGVIMVFIVERVAGLRLTD